ncbi:Superkiller protein 3, partial [Coemansia sp. RSA 2603]
LTWEEQYLAALRERAPYVGCSGELEDEAMRVAEDLAQHGRCPAAFEMLLDARAAALGHTRDVRALASDYLRAFADLAADDGLVLGAAARALGMMHADGGADAQGVLAEADEGRRRAPGSAFAQTVWAVAAGGAQAYGALAEGAAAARAAVGTGQPGSWLVEFHVGRACLRLGMAESAALAYMRCVALRPDDPAALLGVGLARLALGDAAAAQAHLERALEATPSDEQAAQALAGLGACHLLADADDGASAAAEYLRRALLLDARMAHAHRDLGRALWRQGGAWRRDKQHAYASFLAAARLDPLDAAAFGGLGLWYAEVGHDAARAVKCLEKCVALDVGLQDGRPVERLAALYAQQGCDDRLQRLLERVTAADGQGAAVADRWAWAWRMLGLLYLRMPSDDATQQAERVLRRALALDRRDFVAWVALGDAYLAAGRPGAAARVAAHAASLRPTDPAARYLGARAHLHAGDAERALAEVLLARRLAASSA